MPVDPPGSAALDQVSRHYGLGLGAADVASFEPFVDGLLGSWDAVERLYAQNAPQAPDRPWKRPAPADNPFGAWYVTTSITERSEGPLAGRSVAIKDNTAVAGVPMMNGSSTLEGFQPARDATVVSRLLAAGGYHHRQGGVRGPMFLRRLAHLTERAGTQPMGYHALGGRVLQRQCRPAGRRGGRHRHRRRPGRIGPHPRRLLRGRRAQTDPRAGALHRGFPDRPGGT